MTLMMGGGAPLDQIAFQLRADDADEAGSTIIFTNENWHQADLDTNLRVRFQVTLLSETLSTNIALRYSHNEAPFTRCDASSSVIRMNNSTHFTADTDTTQQLSSGTFISSNQGMNDTDGETGPPDTDFTDNSSVEVEFCFQVRSADVSLGDNIRLRTYNSDDFFTMRVYVQTPRIYVGRKRIWIT